VITRGVQTFLMTDVEGSTRLWEANRDSMTAALQRHDAILTSAIIDAGGTVVKSRGEGDSFFAVFPNASGAVLAAVEIQRRVVSEPPGATLKVRVAVHTGEAEMRDADYYGPVVNRCARMRAVAHGGQILVSDVTASLVEDQLPDGIKLTDLGQHRLRDIAKPVRIFQLTAADIALIFPALTSGASEGNLPERLTSFVGRDTEVEQLVELISKRRLVTITGTGGVGKTSLAVEAARATSGARGAAWMVELAALSDPDLVATATCAVLGVMEQTGRDPSETLAERLRDQTVLLLMDNCEHLTVPAAELSQKLLTRCPGISILATSREPLGVGGEQVMALAPLTDSPAASLFTDRARLGRPDFAIDQSNSTAVGELCRRLDGIPLAIELAAARIRHLTPDQILTRLSDRFAVLKGSTTEARHQTLRATVEWSYELLDESLRRLFASLSVFSGSFALESAEAVCRGDDVFDGLTHLSDRSLVVADESGRYHMLETIRDYAKERLVAQGRADELRKWHGVHFIELAESLRSSGDEDSTTRLGADIENFRSAMKWVEAQDPELGLRLMIALASWWPRRGHMSEGDGWSRRILTRASPDSPLLGLAMHEMGWIAFYGHPEAGIEFFKQSAELAHGSGDARLEGRALNAMGLCLYHGRHTKEAIETIRQALPILEQVDDQVGLAQAEQYMAYALVMLKDLNSAVEWSEKSVQRRRAIGDPVDLALALSLAIHLRTLTGRTDAALEATKEAVACLRINPERIPLTQVADAAAEIRFIRKESREALLLSAASQAIKSKYGVTGLINVTFSLDRLGDLKIAMGPDEMAAIESEAAGLDPPKLVERIARLIA
jgi:predicted ATPase/class 3 adenylate cyclase